MNMTETKLVYVTEEHFVKVSDEVSKLIEDHQESMVVIEYLLNKDGFTFYKNKAWFGR